jgi:hypothetical protein
MNTHILSTRRPIAAPLAPVSLRTTHVADPWPLPVPGAAGTAEGDELRATVSLHLHRVFAVGRVAEVLRAIALEVVAPDTIGRTGPGAWRRPAELVRVPVERATAAALAALASDLAAQLRGLSAESLADIDRQRVRAALGHE